MKRLLLVLATALLVLEVSGLAEMVRPESCPPVESASGHQDSCSVCVRCACCTQPVVQGGGTVSASGLVIPGLSTFLPQPSPDDPQVRDILHVPKASFR